MIVKDKSFFESWDYINSDIWLIWKNKKRCWHVIKYLVFVYKHLLENFKTSNLSSFHVTHHLYSIWYWESFMCHHIYSIWCWERFTCHHIYIIYTVLREIHLYNKFMVFKHVGSVFYIMTLHSNHTLICQPLISSCNGWVFMGFFVVVVYSKMFRKPWILYTSVPSQWVHTHTLTHTHLGLHTLYTHTLWGLNRGSWGCWPSLIVL